MDKTINVQVSTYEGVSLTGRARGHVVMIDRPKEKGGHDRGPMGGELLLLGLGGCYMSTFLAALREQTRDIDTKLVSVNVQGRIVAAPSRFSEIAVLVAAPEEYREFLLKPFVMAERGCLVHNTLKQSLPVRFEYLWTKQENQAYC